jgi:nucleoside-diphosphate-sugar epimerase
MFTTLGAQVDTTPWTPEAMEATLRRLRPQLVFCCIGTTRARMKAQGESANSYEAIDYGMPKMLAEASAKAGGVTRFVYLSSMGAAANAQGAYLQWRWKAEEAVRSSGVPWTIARPSIITGHRDEERRSEALAGVALDGVLNVLGVLGAKTLRARYRSTTDARLAGALARLALDPDAADQVVLSEGLY